MRFTPVFLLLASANAMAQPATIPTWTLTRDVRMGSSTDTAAALLSPMVAIVGPNGQTLVFDYGTRQIKVYDPNGRFQRIIGRQGQGPGEFNRVLTMGFLGDTLWTNDNAQQRITLFPPGSNDLKSFELRYETGTVVRGGGPGANTLVAASPKAMLKNGLAVAQGSFTAGDRSNPPKPTPSPIVLMRRDGTVIDTVSTPVHHMSRSISIRVGNTTWLSGQPFLTETFWGARSDGRGFAVVDVPPVRPNVDAVFTVQAFDSTGKPAAMRSYRYQPVLVTNRLRDSVAAAIRERFLGRGANPAQLDSARQLLVVPTHLPTVTALRAGKDGSLWLRRESVGNSGRAWSVINPQGALVASVTVPDGANVIYADMEQVLAIETDANGEDWVVRYRVGRS